MAWVFLNIKETSGPFISNKLGYGINNLRNYLCKIHKIKSNIPGIIKTENKEKNPNIFIIQETYNIKGIGIVFYGYMKKGQIWKSSSCQPLWYNNVCQLFIFVIHDQITYIWKSSIQ